MILCLFVWFDILDIFSDIGEDIYIVYLYNPSIQSNFRIKYKIEKCEFGDWKVGQCSKSCGGGQRLDNRPLLNPSANKSSCGPLLKVVPCNVHSCTAPLCKNIEFISAKINLTFTLQNIFINSRVVYRSSRYEYYLYSIIWGDSIMDGAWAIANYPGVFALAASWHNRDCKGTEDPGSGSCEYGWLFLTRETVLVVDSSARLQRPCLT